MLWKLTIVSVSGGSIVGVRCTETFYGSSRQETLFGFPIWYKEYSPRTVIQVTFLLLRSNAFAMNSAEMGLVKSGDQHGSAHSFRTNPRT